MVGGPPELCDLVEGAHGELEIVKRFKELYRTLYNSAKSEAEGQV